MKKKFTSLLILILLIPLYSCGKDLINNADTGEITLTENRHTYSDGTYFCGYDYFDSDGLCAVAKITVNGGIITGVRFDYFDIKENALSEDTEIYEQTAAELKSIRKTLFNRILANQDISGMNVTESRFSKDYYTLISAILYNARTGGEKILLSKSINTYNTETALTENVLATLTVTYVSDEISEINFDITDLSHSSLSLDGTTCTGVFGLSSEDTLRAIHTCEDISSGELRKENTEEALKAVFDVYDALCEDIIGMRIKTDFDYEKLF